MQVERPCCNLYQSRATTTGIRNNYGYSLCELGSYISGVDKRVVSKRVVLADVPPERKPERGYVRQNHPFTKPPFYLPVNYSDRFSDPFSRFSNRFSYRFKNFSGANSFCTRAALRYSQQLQVFVMRAGVLYSLGHHRTPTSILRWASLGPICFGMGHHTTLTSIR